MKEFFERRAPWLLAGLILLFYWRLVLFGDRFTYLEHADPAWQIAPWLAAQARFWSGGEFPLWNPYEWGGQPMLGLMQTGAAFPLNWPLFAAHALGAGDFDFRLVHWHWAALHALGGLFAFALARELGASRGGAFVAGAAFACVGFPARMAWPQILNGVVWTPLAFLFLHRAIERGGGWRAMALAGGSIGMCALSGHPRTPLFAALAAGSVAVWAAVRRPPEERARHAGGLALMAAVALAAGALQILPAVEFGRDAVRWAGTAEPLDLGERVPYFVEEGLRLNPVHVFAAVVAIEPGAGDPFVGWALLSLALIGAVSGRPWAGALAAVGLGGLLYAFGPQTAFHGWFYALFPFADKARGAPHALFLFHFAAAALAAHGFDALAEGGERRGVERLLWGFAATASAMVLWLLLSGSRAGAATGYHGEFVMFAALTAALAGAAFTALRRGLCGADAARWALLATMLLEGGAAHWLAVVERGDPHRPQYLRDLDEPRAALDFLRARHAAEGPFRFEVVPDGGAMNRGSWLGLESAEGYLTVLGGNVFRLTSGDWAAGRDLLNTVYTIAQAPTRPEQERVFDDSEGGWNVYRNPAARPRAWIEPDSGGCAGEDRIEHLAAGANFVRLRVQAGCAGTLVYSAVWAPGWRAWVDGEETPVEEVHGALRGLAVPAGDVAVELRYRPRSVIRGGALSLAGFGLCAFACATWRRPHRLN